jgi:uncharacterized protein
VPVDPFVVPVARLRRRPGTRQHEARQGVFDPSGERRPPTTADTEVPPGAEATCDVVLESFDGGVMVRGTVHAPWRGVCSRCTTSVGGEVTVALRERFVPAADLGAATRHRPVPGALGPEADEEAYPIVDEQLDLGPMVRDTVVLALPLAPRCRPDCQGLCPDCGVNRNEVDCECAPPRDPRWANLDVLRSPEEPPRAVERTPDGP